MVLPAEPEFGNEDLSSGAGSGGAHESPELTSSRRHVRRQSSAMCFGHSQCG